MKPASTARPKGALRSSLTKHTISTLFAHVLPRAKQVLSAELRIACRSAGSRDPSTEFDLASRHRGSDSKNLLIDGGTQILGQQVSVFKFLPCLRSALRCFDCDLP